MENQILLFFVCLFNFILFNFTILYWFCDISKWICHRYTCVPHPEPSSLLPPQKIVQWNPKYPSPGFNNYQLTILLHSELVCLILQIPTIEFRHFKQKLAREEALWRHGKTWGLGVGRVWVHSLVLVLRETCHLFTPHFPCV